MYPLLQQLLVFLAAAEDGFDGHQCESTPEKSDGEEGVRHGAPVVLPVVEEYAPVMMVNRPQPHLLAALSDVVKDSGKGDIVNVPSPLPEALAQVDVLYEEKEVLVEAADVLQCLPPQEHRRAGDPVNGPRLAVVPIRQEELPAEPVVREEPADDRVAAEEYRAVGGEGATGELNGSVRIDYFAAGSPDTGFFIQEDDGLREAIICQN